MNEKTHVVIQQYTWQEGEVKCADWNRVSDPMSETEATSLAKLTPSSAVIKVTDPLPKPTRK